MSPYKRNLLVGIVVLLAVATFGWMILRFGTKTATLFAPKQVALEIQTPCATGCPTGRR